MSTEDQKSAVIKLNCIPYGFFETEILGYFRQFGKVARVRLARSKKTGEHKGWAWVKFLDKTVAQVAAEAMHGYLMFDKRLKCTVLTKDKVPDIMKRGARIVAPPHRYGNRLKQCKTLNKPRSEEAEKLATEARKHSLEKKLKKLRNMGVDYELEGVSIGKKGIIRVSDGDLEKAAGPKEDGSGPTTDRLPAAVKKVKRRDAGFFLSYVIPPSDPIPETKAPSTAEQKPLPAKKAPSKAVKTPVATRKAPSQAEKTPLTTKTDPISVKTTPLSAGKTPPLRLRLRSAMKKK